MVAGGVVSASPAWTSLYRANSSGAHASIRFVFLGSRLCYPASFRRSLAVPPLRFACPSRHHGGQGTFTPLSRSTCPAHPVDARHAGRVPALPPPAWARSPVAPPERRAEAGCPVAAVTRRRRLSPPGSFRPSSRLRFRGRARRGRGCGLTGSTHQRPMPPTAAAASQERAQAARSGRTHSLLSAPLAPADAGAFRGLVAVAFFQRLDFRPKFLPMSGHLHRMRSRFAR